MTPTATLPTDRFLTTLWVVAREGRHLAYSRRRVYSQPIDAEWVCCLEGQPEVAERLEAFVSRFGRMQDTIATKLLPRWLMAQAEEPGSLLETLNRAERLRVLEDAEQWLEARNLRIRLVHEYMENPERFAADLLLANGYCDMLFGTYHRVREFALTRLGITEDRVPNVVNPL
ncbi:MAG: hypothetical protein L0H73_07975 [Nitrococcus sp.]|nr:hypothetical protein [Nitrococcus sp.]